MVHTVDFLDFNGQKWAQVLTCHTYTLCYYVLLDSYYTYLLILFKNRSQHRAYDALGLAFCFLCKAKDYSIDGRNTEYYQCPRVYIIEKDLIFMINYQAFFYSMDRFQTMGLASAVFRPYLKRSFACIAMCIPACFSLCHLSTSGRLR